MPERKKSKVQVWHLAQWWFGQCSEKLSRPHAIICNIPGWIFCKIRKPFGCISFKKVLLDRVEISKWFCAVRIEQICRSWKMRKYYQISGTTDWWKVHESHQNKELGVEWHLFAVFTLARLAAQYLDVGEFDCRLWRGARCHSWLWRPGHLLFGWNAQLCWMLCEFKIVFVICAFFQSFQRAGYADSHFRCATSQWQKTLFISFLLSRAIFL